MWVPLTVFSNQVSRKTPRTTLFMSSTGTMTYIVDTELTIKCVVNFRSFPADRTPCPISVFIDMTMATQATLVPSS